MDDSCLNRVLNGHRKVFTDSELVAAAFNSSMDFISWDDWFQRLKKKLSREDFRKLFVASASVLKSLSAEVNGFRVGVITPERSATELLSESDFIPREFLIFLCSKEDGLQ